MISIHHSGHSPEEQRWLEGVTLIQRKLMAVLEGAGVTRIEAQDCQFDPREHEALLYEETKDQPEGTVLRVILDGYKLSGRILRASQVSVAKPTAPRPVNHKGSKSTKDNPSGKKEV